jgi:hypothetical protein
LPARHGTPVLPCGVSRPGAHRFRTRGRGTRGARSRQGTRRELALQRFARLQDIIDQDDERFAFSAVAADFLAPRRFVLRVAAMDQPVSVSRLAAAFAFWQGSTGVLHSNLKKGGGGYPHRR